MFDKSEFIITKDVIKRKNFLKKEFKKIILKSIIQNLRGGSLSRVAAIKQMNFFKKKCSISRQNNVCLLTSRTGGVFKK
jgi:hypothetical protein